VVLIGHSMGGLIVRDFVSRLRHPEGAAPAVGGPAVAGVILAIVCLYMGATDQIDTAEMIITTLTSLFISVIAAIEDRNLKD
jgi:alpha-beta hydrolase superfamily lysophospholipase